MRVFIYFSFLVKIEVITLYRFAAHDLQLQHTNTFKSQKYDFNFHVEFNELCPIIMNFTTF